MHESRFFKKGAQNIFRIDKAFNIKINIINLDSQYKLHFSEISHVSKTGSLILFTVNSIVDNKILFMGRWDQNYSTVDVDILGKEKRVVEFFNSEKNGYTGHHPKRISEKSLTYDLKLVLPEKEILSAQISFNVGYGHEPGLFS